MKKMLFATEFFLVSLIFLLPPLTFFPGKSTPAPQEIKLTFFCLSETLVCVLLLFHHKDLYLKKYKFTQKPDVFTRHSAVLLSFGILIFISIIFQIILCLLKRHFQENTGSFLDLVPPSSPLLWLSFFSALLCGAFCEEFLYRFYLPDFGSELFPVNRFPFWEVLSVLVFGFSHSYLGIAGILNAISCGTILRLLFLKTKSLAASAGVHFFYNLFTAFSAIFFSSTLHS
ncbi:CPBP family intramembrane glutamic endopeptidase [uncultured Treponema sp.]|uniref:CPBP family intramembrane glutamic endopeptidase n=1 Tax=uncultured Treponema sp. TaxID=162155 RepID=UPI0015BE010F|nr:CPBP family glutamic-type intramembrane protease [uncultured Treponema sp.]